MSRRRSRGQMRPDQAPSILDVHGGRASVSHARAHRRRHGHDEPRWHACARLQRRRSASPPAPWTPRTATYCHSAAAIAIRLANPSSTASPRVRRASSSASSSNPAAQLLPRRRRREVGRGQELDADDEVVPDAPSSRPSSALGVGAETRLRRWLEAR
jgi:hypothetical protein